MAAWERFRFPVGADSLGLAQAKTQQADGNETAGRGGHRPDQAAPRRQILPGGGDLATIAVKIADLRRMAGVLSEMVRRCEGGDVPGCPIIDALFEPARAGKDRPGVVYQTTSQR